LDILLPVYRVGGKREMRNTVWMLMAFFGSVLAENIPYTGHLSTGYERMFLPGSEPMGLLKVGALFDVNPYLYFGSDLYSAVYGKRGGFFTVGVEGGVHFPLSRRLELNSGVFLGAGGGGSAPQGGGLMVRPYAGVTYDLGLFALEAGMSRVWFPNGKIDSTQIYAGISMPFGGRYWGGHGFDHTGVPDNDAEASGVTTHVLLEHYRPAGGVHDVHSTKATEPYSLAGVEFVVGSGSVYHFFQAAGAGAGSSTGYMEVFGGMGYRYRAGDLFSLGIQGAIGAAGGGRVDTGGGLMYRGDVVLDVPLFDHLHLGARYGQIGAFAGSFNAISYGMTFGYEERFFGLGDPTFLREDTALSAWRFRLMNKSYLPTKGMFNDGQVNRIDLIGIALNRFLTPNIYVTGESFWAWQGQAGGYAEGVFGLGYQTDSYRGFHLYAEGLAGVGGGGDVHMDGGMFISVGGGITYDIDRSTQLYLGTAYVRSRTGGFRSTSIDVGLNYNFSLMSD